MSEDQLNTVLDRVYQLEQSDLKRNIQNRSAFIIQFFLLLVVILGIGYYFYQNLQDEIQKVNLSQSLHFSKLTNDKLNSRITSKIVSQIEENEQVRTAIKNVVRDNFQGKIEEMPVAEEAAEKTDTTPLQVSEPASESDKPATEIKIADASETVPGRVADDNVPKEPTASESTKDFKAAAKFETQGFTHLLAGELDQAITAFTNAEVNATSYHQVYEIARLLHKERANLDDPEKRRQVYQQIVNDMSYGAPPEMLEQLRKLANKDGIVIKTDS